MARIFVAAFRRARAAIFMYPINSPRSPHRSAGAVMGANPAHDTRLGSSNRALIARLA